VGLSFVPFSVSLPVICYVVDGILFTTAPVAGVYGPHGRIYNEFTWEHSRIGDWNLHFEECQSVQLDAQIQYSVKIRSISGLKNSL
jgi:hypothetical protein